jgi:hypothetical protein
MESGACVGGGSHLVTEYKHERIALWHGRSALLAWNYDTEGKMPRSGEQTVMNSMICKRVPIRGVLRGLTTAGAFCVATAVAFAQTVPSTNRSRAFGPDACGPVDPAFISAANETGGIPMFLQKSEARQTVPLAKEWTRSNVSTVFWATGTLEGKSRSIGIPVDSVTQRLTVVFSVGRKGSELKLTQPSGGAITQGLGHVEVTELNCGRIVTVNAPEAGEWHAEITGTGSYWIEAKAQSDIHIIGAEFVKKGGRPGHEGLFRIQGQPLAGSPASLAVSLSSDGTKSREFCLVNEQGEPIQKLEMHEVSSAPGFLEMVGRVEPPSVAFRVAVMGRDAKDKPYQRFFATLFHGESVEVSARNEFDEMPMGSTKQVEFRVRNIGATRSFRVTVTDVHQFVVRVEPKELTLKANETGTVRVDLVVPGPAQLVRDNLVVVVASTAGPPTSNSYILAFTVSATDRSEDPR